VAVSAFQVDAARRREAGHAALHSTTPQILNPYAQPVVFLVAPYPAATFRATAPPAGAWPVRKEYLLELRPAGLVGQLRL
jgi:hypothetical protein